MVTSFFSGFGRRYWKGATAREVFKFSLYLSIPLGTSIFYANPDFMHWLIMKLNLVHYPESVPAPPTGQEFENLRNKMIQAKKAADKAKLEEQKRTPALNNNASPVSTLSLASPASSSPPPTSDPTPTRTWVQWAQSFVVTPTPPPPPSFIPSPKFVGSKEGYVFTTREGVVGYYLDETIKPKQ